MSGAVLKILEGRPFSGDRRDSLWDAVKGNAERNTPVRPLYYLSRCYPMNTQCIIWIADKGHNFSRVPENFCIFASSYVTAVCPDNEISYQIILLFDTRAFESVFFVGDKSINNLLICLSTRSMRCILILRVVSVYRLGKQLLKFIEDFISRISG